MGLIGIRHGARPHAHDSEVESLAGAYWALPPAELFEKLQSRPDGLRSEEAVERLGRFGANQLREPPRLSRLLVLVRQLASPLLFLLVIAAVIAAATGELFEAAIVLAILLGSVGIGYQREHSAHTAAAALRARIAARAKVRRGGEEHTVAAREIVPGDVVLLAAGSLVPADGLVLEASDCYVSEAALTGESLPLRKVAAPVPVETPLRGRTNCVFAGTNVRSGTARCLVVATGAATEFGAIAKRLELRRPRTEFDSGLRRFGYLLTSSMLVMVLLIFTAHMLDGRPVVETMLFAVALAVGLSPELLPAILSVNLARGAAMMARRGVLVRHLNAIENLGSMDVLCTDKTGTLTEGAISMEGGYDTTGAPSAAVVELAALNAALETGLPSPLDEAIVAHEKADLSAVRKLAEIPFDFARKRVSVVIERNGRVELVCKGAFGSVAAACTTLSGGGALDTAARERLEHLHEGWSAQGVRVLAVAHRTLAAGEHYDRSAERNLAFAGFVTFLDPPKEGAAEALADLRALSIQVKLISGDTRLVAQHVAGLIGMKCDRVLAGAQLDSILDEALWHEVERTDLFVEVDPQQKERIILALKKTGHVVGFLGDGVNDAPAMHAADTSISVEHAVDVAREAADFVLLQRDLNVLRRGVEEGRRTFANTIKYVLTTTSANLGNMLSMAAASLVLPFLPLTGAQILLNNFVSDLPAVGIADDNVDPELVREPRRWDTRFIGRFMLKFGLLSSLFDLLTFAALIWIFRASAAVFQTAWFVESLLTELVIALVVRTRRPFYRSRPGNALLGVTLVLIAATPAIPYLPWAGAFGFTPIPPMVLATIIVITVLYVVATEWAKRWFYRA